MSKINNIVTQIKEGKTSAKEQVEIALQKAEEHTEHNVFLAINRVRALKRAEEIDKKHMKHEPIGRLAGVPFVAKDNFLTIGSPTTAASKILEDFSAPFQATAIEKLEAEGAICIGKANLDAFAHGSSTENSAFGVTKNAIDTNRVAGGSSGGSAVAIALDIAPFALGTDTGGSIRQPASFNGVVGFKPTYGAISRYGVVAMASSTDVVGPITQTMAANAIILDILTGKDNRYGTTLDDFFSISAAPKPKQKIGLIKEFMGKDVDEDIKKATLAYADALAAKGHVVEEVRLPMVHHSLAMYYIIVPAEISSNLARYDGIRYGKRAKNAKSLAEVYGQSRSQGFMPENIRRIMIGSYVLSSGYFDAYYQQAQKARTILIKEMNYLFDEYDVLIGPTTPAPAFLIGENSKDPVKMYLSDMMTVFASLSGAPALSVPAGTTKDGLPIGVQLVGQNKTDANILSLAKSIEVSRHE